MLCPDSNTDLLPAPKGFKLQSIYAYYPEWLLANNFNNWQERTRISVIYQLKKTE
jgi:hypothetical protein